MAESYVHKKGNLRHYKEKWLNLTLIYQVSIVIGNYN